MAIKFNGGKLALICDSCGVILATGSEIPKKAFENDTVWVCDDECAIKYHKELDKRMYKVTMFLSEQIVYSD